MKEETANDEVLAASIDQVVLRKENNLSDDEVERRVTESFAMLSMKERTEALHDVHGVCDTIEETPSFVDGNLVALDEELARKTNNPSSAGKSSSSVILPSPSSLATAYHLACSKFPEFVHSREFRLRILRAERFDSKKAAGRTLHYFDWKLKLFGEALLGREIQLKDLNEDGAIALLRSGNLRMLPNRDQAGRLIIFCTMDVFSGRWPLIERVSRS
jgi:hypothetical protein